MDIESPLAHQPKVIWIISSLGVGVISQRMITVFPPHRLLNKLVVQIIECFPTSSSFQVNFLHDMLIKGGIPVERIKIFEQNSENLM